MIALIKESLSKIKDTDELINQINELRSVINEYSPFKDNPVDLVLWKKSNEVFANDYNPNSVAPPEMELLKTSIMEDGYTQPIAPYELEAERLVPSYRRICKCLLRNDWWCKGLSFSQPLSEAYKKFKKIKTESKKQLETM